MLLGKLGPLYCFPSLPNKYQKDSGSTLLQIIHDYKKAGWRQIDFRFNRYHKSNPRGMLLSTPASCQL